MYLCWEIENDFFEFVCKKGILVIKFMIVLYCEYFYFVLFCFYVVGFYSLVVLVFVSI